MTQRGGGPEAAKVVWHKNEQPLKKVFCEGKCQKHPECFAFRAKLILLRGFLTPSQST